MAIPTEREDPRSLPGVVLDNLTTAVVLLDERLRVSRLNLSAEVLFETSENMVRGAALTDVLPRARVYARFLRRVAREEHPVTEREMRLSLPSGRAVIVDCTVSPVNDGERYLLVELVDQERHRRVTREQQLVAQSASVRALLRGLAHEIRNPLGGLRGAAQLLGRELAEPELMEYTDVIIREADRLQALLERMLGPRTSAGQRLLNVHEVTERVWALLAAEAGEGVRVLRDYDPSIPSLRADPESLIQALLNVARNALQAVGERGTITLRTRIHSQTTIGSRRHRLVMSIDVVDTGRGVPKDLGESIFYPMVSGRPGGSGLGLAIAQSLVSQQGGLIEFQRDGARTVFSIRLPCEEET